MTTRAQAGVASERWIFVDTGALRSATAKKVEGSEAQLLAHVVRDSNPALFGKLVDPNINFAQPRTQKKLGQQKSGSRENKAANRSAKTRSLQTAVWPAVRPELGLLCICLAAGNDHCQPRSAADGLGFSRFPSPSAADGAHPSMIEWGGPSLTQRNYSDSPTDPPTPNTEASRV